MADYIVGVKVKGVVVEFRSKPISDEEHAVAVYMTMKRHPDYDAILYRENKKKKLKKVPKTEIDRILNSES